MRGSLADALEVEVIPLAALERKIDERPAPDARRDDDRVGVEVVERAHLDSRADVDARLRRRAPDRFHERPRIDAALVGVVHSALDRAGERRLERTRLVRGEHCEP